MKKSFQIGALATFLIILVFSNLTIIPVKGKPFWELPKNEAQQILNQLTLEEKVGQLFMIGAFSLNDSIDKEHIIKPLIKNYHIGGLMFQQGTPINQIRLVNYYQSISKIPLLIAQDCEWGLSMRLNGPIKFPHNMALGAIQNNQLIYELGLEIGRQCSLVGNHINFAPVVDVNYNPENPVINDRSFGENKEKVEKKSIAFMRGLQDARIFACVKHFPGHGNTSVDSHLALPVINQSLEDLKQIELYPFEKTFQHKVQSVMIAHLCIPCLDATKPSSMSNAVVTDLLQKQMLFKGLIFTDSLNMKAITNNYSLAEAAYEAFLAGADILLMNPGAETVLSSLSSKSDSIQKVPPEALGNISSVIKYLVQAVKKEKISEKEIDWRVLKILLAKQWHRLFENRCIPVDITLEKPPLTIHKLVINSPEAKSLKQTLFDNAITLVKNNGNLLPLKEDTQKIAIVHIGRENHYSSSPFLYNLLSDFASISFYIPTSDDNENYLNLLNKLKDYDTIIIGMYEMNKFSSKNWGITEKALNLLEGLNKENKKVILTLFGNPYSLKLFGNEQAIIVAYEDEPEAEIAVTKIIKGKLKPKGNLPITASESFREGDGLTY